MELKFKAADIDSDEWYLAALSSISTAPESHFAGQLYLYLISQHAYFTKTER
jgi:hypothetical protein